MIVIGISRAQLTRLMRKGAEVEPLRPLERPSFQVIEGCESQFSPRSSPARQKR